MTSIADTRKLVESLYDSGDLSHDQANPILAALDVASELLPIATGMLECLEAGDPWTKSARVNAAKGLRAAIAKATGGAL